MENQELQGLIQSVTNSITDAFNSALLAQKKRHQAVLKPITEKTQGLIMVQEKSKEAQDKVLAANEELKKQLQQFTQLHLQAQELQNQVNSAANQLQNTVQESMRVIDLTNEEQDAGEVPPPPPPAPSKKRRTELPRLSRDDDEDLF